MKRIATLKTPIILGLAAMVLMAGASQAEGYIYYRGAPAPAVNPWMAEQQAAYQQANYQAALKRRVVQFNKLQEHQLQRILDGMEKGRLTMREATVLLREHLAIAALERDYLTDGRLGPNELRDLENRLSDAGHHIKVESRDRDRAGDGYRRYEDRRDDYRQN